MVSTTERVPSQTDEQINEKIRRQTEMNIQYYAAHPEQIEQHLQELDQEWDTERTLETSAAVMSLAGFTLGVLRGRLWWLLPPVVAGFLLQHAVQGWCPPLEVIRRLGVRTSREIDTERYALKILRGDFGAVAKTEKGTRPQAKQVMEAVGE